MMVDREGRYYRDPFVGTKEVAQVELLSHAIFNVVVYAIILHWDTVVFGESEVPGEFGRVV